MTRKMESAMCALAAVLPLILVFVAMAQVDEDVSSRSVALAKERSEAVSHRASSLLDTIFGEADSIVSRQGQAVIDPSAVAAAHPAISSVAIFDPAGFQLSRWPPRSAGSITFGQETSAAYTRGGSLVRTSRTADQRGVAIVVSIRELRRSLDLETTTQLGPIGKAHLSGSPRQILDRYPLEVTTQPFAFDTTPTPLVMLTAVLFSGVYLFFLRWTVARWRKRYELLREKNQDIEKELQHIRSDFLGNVAKELLGPLSHVLGLTGTLAGRWDDLTEEKKRLLVERIGANAESMEEMVEELMDYARIEQGTYKLLPRICSLPMECGGVVEKLKPLLRAHRVVCMVPEDLSVIADPRALRRVLEILLSNATRFSPVGSLIMLRAHRSGEQVAISVDDEGPCVPADDAERVFERYYKRGGEKCGPGVGLWIARDFVSSMGGELRLETSDRGSTFCFTLPARLGANVTLPQDDVLVGRKFPKSHGATGM